MTGDLDRQRDDQQRSGVGNGAPGARARLLLVGLAAIAAVQAPDLARGAGVTYRAPSGEAVAERADGRWIARPGAADPRPMDHRVTGERRARARMAPGARDSRPPEGARMAPSDIVPLSSDIDFYDPSALRTIFIDFTRPDWEQQLAIRYRTGADLPAAVTIDGRVYRDAGIRFRGNSSYRQVPPGFKRSFNVSLDAVHGDQEVGGYRTLNLLNANGDPTFVRTVLYSEIARQYGPAPKANFVRVVVNGESWGIFVNLQQFNKDFLRDEFGTTKGTRWKVPGSPRGRAGLEYLGESVELYRSLYEIKSKDDEKAWADLIRLCRLLNTTAPEHLEAVIAPHLDIDSALRFLAVDVALVNSDGYWTRASDYSLYQDPAGRFHVVPYDFNEALGAGGGPRRRGGGFGGGPALDPLVGMDDPSKPLRSKLLAVPALRERYLAHVADIARNGLNWDTLNVRVRRHQALIGADVMADGRKLYANEAFDPAGLQRFVDARRAYLLSGGTVEEGER
jgi:hypothetical protein